MELRLLRYFLAVVDAGSTAAASHSLGVAQPSLSRQVRRLEAELGVSLFDRRGGRLHLTDAGRHLVPRARDLLARADELRREVRHDLSAPLEVAAPLTTIVDVIAPFLAVREGTAWPVRPREVVPVEAFAAVARGEADVAISSGPVPPGLASRSLMRPPIWAYLPARHPLARHRSVDVATLAEQPLVVLSPDHGTRRLFDGAVADVGASYEPVAEVGLGLVAQALAAAGRGIAIVSDEPRFDLRRVRIRAGRSILRIPLFAAWDAQRYSAPAVGLFVDALVDYCQRVYASPLVGR